MYDSMPWWFEIIHTGVEDLSVNTKASGEASEAVIEDLAALA